MAKKELKPEYQPGGAKRHVIIDKAVKYLVEFPGLQSDKKFFLLDEIGLSTTEYLEALNRASNGELVKTALGDQENASQVSNPDKGTDKTQFGARTKVPVPEQLGNAEQPLPMVRCGPGQVHIKIQRGF